MGEEGEHSGSMARIDLFPGFAFVRAFIDAFFRVQGNVPVVRGVNQQVEGGSPVFLVGTLLPVSGVAFAGVHALAVQRDGEHEGIVQAAPVDRQRGL